MHCDRHQESGGRDPLRGLRPLSRAISRACILARTLTLSLTRSLIWALPLSACAVSYVDDAGNQHVIGFASIVIAPSAQNQPTAGNVVDLTTVGLSLNSMPEGRSLSLGYSRAVTATLKNNVLVLGNPLEIRPLVIREQRHALTENAAAAMPDYAPVYDGGCDVCALPVDDGLR